MEHYFTILKCKPIIHTHYAAKGGKFEKERAWLEDQIHHYWATIGEGYGGSYPAYKDRAKLRDKIAKFKKGEIEDIINEKIPKEYEW